MEDPVLNRNLEETKELQTRWNQFHDFVNMAAQQGLAKITPQAELKFLELKSKIAMLHDGFMGGVKSDPKTAQNIIQIVADCIMLKKVAVATEAERQKFEFDWNECFMLLNETVSTMEEEKKRLGAINERTYKAQKAKELMKARIHNFLHSPILKWCVIIFGTIIALASGEIFYGYRNLYINPPFGMNFTKGMYKGFVGSVWRPFIMKDYEYNDYDEVDKKPNPDTAGGNNVDNNKRKVTEKNFFTTFMPQIGFSSSVINEARKLYEEDKKGPGVKAIDVSQVELQGYNTFVAILFVTSADAKKYIELWNQGLASLSDKKTVTEKCHVFRRANLVVIGHGPHPLHYGYAKDKWNFKDEDNLIK